MTKDGIDYLRGIYRNCLNDKNNDNSKYPDYSRGYLAGRIEGNLRLIECIAEFERFKIIEE